MPPDSFVQRLVNYSASCRLIRELITTGRQLRWLGEFEKPITVIAYVVFIRERMRNPMCRTVKQSMTWRCSRQEKAMTKFALYVPLQAKPGKEKEVADFLRSAVPLVNAEPGTISWFAIQEGPSSFAIFDTFDDEAGRDAHLNGKVAAALMEKAKAGDLFAKTPEIHKLGILVDKLPK
jgi:quinol monooxygenase YgiN